MSYKADNSGFDKVLMPDTASGSNSRSFIPPNGAKVLSIHPPSLGGATLKIQALDPQDSDQSAETWRDVNVAVITATIAFCALATIPQSVVTTIPVAALGSGIFRFVASSGQGAVDSVTILLRWGYDG